MTGGQPPDSDTDADYRVRTARADETDELVQFLIRGRAHVSGSRHPAILSAFLHDAHGDRPRTSVLVVERAGELAGALLAVNGDLPRYYRELPLRHPLAAAALFSHRVRKLPNRLLQRRRSRRRATLPTGAHPPTVDALADEPRLQQPPHPAGSPGPRPSDHGSDIAFCLFVLIDEAHRGRGLSTVLLKAALGHVRALGAARYDCNFVGRDIAAAKLYLSMPFDIQRFPGGYFASIDLREIKPERVA